MARCYAIIVPQLVSPDWAIHNVTAVTLTRRYITARCCTGVRLTLNRCPNGEANESSEQPCTLQAYRQTVGLQHEASVFQFNRVLARVDGNTDSGCHTTGARPAIQPTASMWRHLENRERNAVLIAIELSSIRSQWRKSNTKCSFILRTSNAQHTRDYLRIRPNERQIRVLVSMQ